MPLTIVIGSSGSGKTTFLNDVYKNHKCIYVRQYHNMRPYITVSKIPHFDPTQLSYWNTYQQENVDTTIQVGGTMAGQTVQGLSGGQRKLLLFELICQRVQDQHGLLIVFDEPFAGVTDDFVPFITERLKDVSRTNNIVLVTNDHIESLTKIADNTIRITSIDRFNVLVNNKLTVNREITIAALSLGDTYQYTSENRLSDLVFFWEVEIRNNNALKAVSVFTIVSFGLFLLSFWNSNEAIAALIIVGASMIAFFCIYPYLIALVDWRNAMLEESEALVHSSKNVNKLLKTCLTFGLIVIVTTLEFGSLNVVVHGFDDFEFWVAMLFDFASLTFYLIVLGIYTRLPFEAVQIFGSIPFVLMIFFSTTFSPGSGVPALKELRYVFPRYYLWCMIPGVQDYMEGCPSDDVNLFYLILSSMIGPMIFIATKLVLYIRKNAVKTAKKTKVTSLSENSTFQELQLELYGEMMLQRLQNNIGLTTSGSRTSESESSAPIETNSTRSNNSVKKHRLMEL